MRMEDVKERDSEVRTTQLQYPAASIWFENWGSWVLKVQQKEARSTGIIRYNPRNFYLI